MKRIAIVHQEFLSEGIPDALHLNARTDRDWERWSEYVMHVSFEFATGGGWGERMDWHAYHLAQLASAVGRPLHLILRGGTKVLRSLAAELSGLTVLETSVFVKTMKRQQAQLNAKGLVEWSGCPTESAEMLDRLFAAELAYGVGILCWAGRAVCAAAKGGRVTPKPLTFTAVDELGFAAARGLLDPTQLNCVTAPKDSARFWS
jgi:hypothetical protein